MGLLNSFIRLHWGEAFVNLYLHFSSTKLSKTNKININFNSFVVINQKPLLFQLFDCKKNTAYFNNVEPINNMISREQVFSWLQYINYTSNMVNYTIILDNICK